jgi:acetyl-CoA C-acetyltransferase
VLIDNVARLNKRYISQAQAVMSGNMDIVIAGGVESMTRTPMFSTVALPKKNGMGHYMSPELQTRYPNIEFSQFSGAEMMAKQYDISKDELNAYSLESHRRASVGDRETCI